MPLESAVYVNQLVSSYPTGADDRSTADDHVRLVKAVIKATFPSLTGAVTVNQTQLNHLSGLAVNVASTFNSLSASIAGVNSLAAVNKASISALNTQVTNLSASISLLGVSKLGISATAVHALTANSASYAIQAASASNAGKWDGATKYISTASPTGGVDGDLWFQYSL